MKGLLIWVGVLFLLSGCAAAQFSKVSPSASQSFEINRIADVSKTALQLTEENQLLLETKLQEVLEFCQPRLSGYEVKSAKQARLAYWLSMSGLVAGSVVSPALIAASASGNAAWTAGFSGWAGATNFAGESLKSSGLSGTTIAETRNKIITSVRDQVSVAIDTTKSFEERRSALMKARSECILYEIAVPSVPASK